MDVVGFICASTGADRDDVIARLVDDGHWPLTWMRIFTAAGVTLLHMTEMGEIEVVPWTAELALKAARVDKSLPKAEQEAQIEEKIAKGSLPPEAIEVLRADGYDVGPDDAG